MNMLRRSIKWVMIIAGALTCTMFYAAFAPHEVLQSNFGQTIEGPVGEVVVRNWGVLVGLVGVLLIYGAFREHTRSVALLVAGASKLVFMGLVLSLGWPLIQLPLGVALVLDAIMVTLFATYLASEALAKRRRV